MAIEINYAIGSNKRFSIDVKKINDADTADDLANGIERWEMKNQSGFQFYSFKDTIDNNASGDDGICFVAPVCIPNYFDQIVKKNAKKYRYNGLFLLRSTDPDKLVPDSGNHGQQGCPWKLVVDPNDPKKACHTFSKNDFHLMAMANWGVCWHVTEHDRPWKYFDPTKHLISADSPVYYDPTLGLFITRDVSFVDKPTP